jgi:hypothetical protein
MTLYCIRSLCLRLEPDFAMAPLLLDLVKGIGAHLRSSSGTPSLPAIACACSIIWLSEAVYEGADSDSTLHGIVNSLATARG